MSLPNQTLNLLSGHIEKPFDQVAENCLFWEAFSLKLFTEKVLREKRNVFGKFFLIFDKQIVLG